MQPHIQADIRAALLDPLLITPDQTARLRGQRCARCGAAGNLRPGGYAYTASEGGGRLGWAVKVCRMCPNWGAR
ncbi:hypothetical protein ACWGAN_22660 [Streptomyces sp. NPDC054945]